MRLHKISLKMTSCYYPPRKYSFSDHWMYKYQYTSISAFDILKSHAHLSRIWSRNHKTIQYTVHLLITPNAWCFRSVWSRTACHLHQQQSSSHPIARSPLYPARHKYHPTEIFSSAVINTWTSLWNTGGGNLDIFQNEPSLVLLSILFPLLHALFC